MTGLEISAEEGKMLEMYRKMLEIRHFEERVYTCLFREVFPERCTCTQAQRLWPLAFVRIFEKKIS